jgi:hypothetical protein
VRAADLADPLAPKPTQFPGKAKSIIWLHQQGAASSARYPQKEAGLRHRQHTAMRKVAQATRRP